MSGQGRPDHVYLTDFGITTQQSAQGGSITQTGQFVGSLSYVAPEQINGLNVDGRADQYSLACSAFEMLAGSLPFQAEGLAVLAAHLNERPPPLTSRRPGSPPAADEVLFRALAKNSSRSLSQLPGVRRATARRVRTAHRG